MKKIGCLLLVLLLLLPLVACNAEDKTDPSSSPQGGENPPQEREPIDMKGYEYNALLYLYTLGGGAMWFEGFDSDTANADVLSATAYERNRAIETDYNCKISHQYVNMFNPYTELSALQSAGKTFEVVVLDQISLIDGACMGLLRNLKKTEGLDLAGKGFDPSSVEQLSLGSALYFVNGDMNVSATDHAMVIAYNQNEWDAINEWVADRLGDAKYADLYGLVAAKEWTLDTMLKIAAEYTLDADPDDGLPLSCALGDRIGYFMYSGCAEYYYFASGGRLTVKDETNFPVLALGSEGSKGVYDALYEKLNVKRNPTIPWGASAERGPNMGSGMTLFSDYLLWDVRRVLHYANISFTYGILPLPTVAAGMTSESIVSGISRSVSASLWAIPVNCANSAYAVEMLEVIAERSGELVKAYDRSVVCEELPATDPSYQTLAGIRKTMVWDFAVLYRDCSSDMKVCNVPSRLITASDESYETEVTVEAIKSAKDYFDSVLLPFRE